MRERRAQPAANDDGIELTQTLRSLRVPVVANDPEIDEVAAGGKVMLFCRDSGSRKWAPRWLSQAGLEVRTPSDHRNALTIAREERPDLIIVEAGLDGPDDQPLYRSLLDAADLEVPVMVMCASAREISGAVEAEPFDIVRKPYEWQVIARRVRAAVDLYTAREQLADSKQSLEKALELADVARIKLRSRESFEPVTGLPNKTKFNDLLTRGMAAVDRDGNKLAVFVVGFNRFRLVVEAMGQEHADLILAEVGKALSDCLLETDRAEESGPGIKAAAAASLDQFRFALMFSYSGDEAEVRSLQQRLLERLSRPIQIAGQTIYLSACLGIAEYPGDARDVHSLLQRADNAMRDAQSRGGGFKYYCTETDQAAARKLRIEHMLHEALDQRDLKLAYQPINRVSDGAPVAAEALLRWTLPDGTAVSPGVFVPVAEESGLMVRVGEFVLEEACRQLAAWRTAGIELPYMCVNVSRVQLRNGDFVNQVQNALARNALDPDSLELELSERGVLAGDTDLLDQLRALKALGVRLAIDDFGTGDSAIAYLKELPVDVLKIDQSYVRGINTDGKDAAIASAMIALGQRLGLYVVAEGIETEDQLATLKTLGCDAFQGFLIARPAAADAISGLLESAS